MCLIIQRNPGFVIPYHKFETAVMNNKDGYGLSFPDDKGLGVLRSSDTPDPEKLYRLINEELIDKHLMIHLRYTTAGKTNLRNTHPFPVLEKNKDGIDLRMAHNGTIFKYKTRAKEDESDTRCFVREFVRPLFKRLIRGMDSTEILSDPFTKELLEEQLSNASVLTFLDDEGNSLICNETGNGGKQEDEWYYSNVYSFNETHREKKVYPIGSKSGAKSVSSSGGTVAGNLGTGTKRFTEIFGVPDPLHLLYLSDDTIDKTIEAKLPAKLLIKELLLEVDTLHEENTHLTNTINQLRKKLQ